MRKKFGRRWIAAISVLSLLAPWSVTAQTELSAVQPVEKEPVSEAAQAFDQIQELPKNIQALLSEVASAKDDVVVPSDDLYELTVQHADGSYTTEVYATPVKYTDDNGETQYIDTAMKDRSVWDVVTFNQTRRNQNGYVDLAYAARVTDGVEVDNAFSLSVPAQKGQKKAVSTETDEGDGKIVYPQAFGENTYVEYINTYSGFKENIVLEKNIGKNTFDFVWESDEYMPVLTDDDKAICVVPKNDPTQSEYTISPLYVYDSFDPTTAEKPSTHKHWTDDCRYDILEQDDGSYIVRAIVSEEYLNHPETVYPVTIDPSVNAGSASSNVDDSFVKESAKTTNYGTYNYLQFGYASGKMYSFVQFNKMPTLAAGAHYTSATFKVTFRTGQDTPAKMKATARWCDTSFAEKKLTWNNRPYGKVAQSSVLPKITNGYLDYYNFTVTDAVRRHYKDGVDVALVFTYQNETYADYNSVVSSEGDAARNPKLTINYTKSTGETAGITNNACYYIRNKATNKYLGLREGGSISVEQQARTGKANQLWKLQYNGKDAYRLASQSLANSYMYTAMDMDGGSVTAIPSQSDKTATGYEFMIEPVTTGYYRVSSKAVSTLYALTGGRYDSEDASVYTYTGANDQQWVFEKYTLSLSAAKNQIKSGELLRLNPSNTTLGITWTSSNNAVAMVNSTGSVMGRTPGTATIVAQAGGASATYTVTVTAVDLTHGVADRGHLYASGVRWYKFIPATSGNYTFASSGALNTYGELYQGGKLLKSDDNSGQNNNFSISQELTANTEYQIKVRGISSNVVGDFYMLVVSDVYGHFSTVARGYPTNSGREEAMRISNEQFDVWPASKLSRYYGWSATDRTNALSSIYQRALATCVGGLVAQQPDAAAALHHFLTGNGADYTVNVNDLCDESKDMAHYRTDNINRLLAASEKMVPVLSTKTVYNTEILNHGVINDNDNWYNTLGGCEFRIKAMVTRTDPSSFTATVQYGVIDFYDWDRTITDMGIKPVSPQDMWELHHGGVGKHFLTTGTSTLTITWSIGKLWGTGATVTISE